MLGTFIKIPTSHAIEILGDLGFDFVVIDAEHAPFDRGDVDHAVLACRAAGVASLVRVTDALPPTLMSPLDCGADGVLVPHVCTAEQAREIVAHCRYRGGKRGFANTNRAGRYGGTGLWEHVDNSDGGISVVAMIEDPEAVEAIDSICAVEGLDALFIGRGDLTIALGEPGSRAPKVTAATETIAAAAQRAGKPVIALAPPGEEADWLKSLGVTVFLVSSDQGFLRQAAAQAYEGYGKMRTDG